MHVLSVIHFLHGHYAILQYNHQVLTVHKLFPLFVVFFFFFLLPFVVQVQFLYKV